METRNEIYSCGWEACREGEEQDDNPYEIHTSNYTYWNDGWFECMICEVKNEEQDRWEGIEL
jgi:hypothetical protein